MPLGGPRERSSGSLCQLLLSFSFRSRGIFLILQHLATDFDLFNSFSFSLASFSCKKENELKVLVSYKIGMGVASPVQVYIKAWRVVIKTAGLGSSSLFVELYTVYMRHYGIFKLLQTRVNGIFRKRQRYRHFDEKVSQRFSADVPGAVYRRPDNTDTVRRCPCSIHDERAERHCNWCAGFHSIKVRLDAVGAYYDHSFS